MSSSMSGFRGPAGGGLRGNAAGGSLSSLGASGGNKIPKGYEQGQVQQFTPEQMELFQQLFGQTGSDSFLSRLARGDQGTFEELEAPAHRQFQGLLGDIGSRFSGGLGGGGMSARHGSGFQNATSQAASDFSQDLASKRQGLQRQALLDLHGISSDLLGQRPYEQFLTKKDMPFWQKLLLGLNEAGSDFAKGAGQAAGKAWF